MTVDEVAVVGWAQTEHRGAMEHETHMSIIYRVVNEALSSCGMSIHDIDVVVDAGSDFLDGRGISTCITVDAMGAHFKEESKVAADGLFAAIYAFMRVATGLFSTALVVAYSKSSESSPLDQSRSQGEPFYYRPLGLDAHAAAALQARAYMHHYGADETAPAGVAVKNRAAGTLNPYAQLREEVTLGEVLEGPDLVSPVKRLEAAPRTDGGCAVVLADSDAARSLRVRPAWITGVGMSQDAYCLGARSLHRATSAQKASAAACSRAGVSDPASQLDLLEVSEVYAHQELMLYEALGLCDEGEGAAFLSSGAPGPRGACPVNVSGGALCANPVMATGLVRLAEVSAQVTERAEGASVRGARRALAHAQGGYAMQSAACVVVET